MTLFLRVYQKRQKKVPIYGSSAPCYYRLPESHVYRQYTLLTVPRPMDACRQWMGFFAGHLSLKVPEEPSHVRRVAFGRSLLMLTLHLTLVKETFVFEIASFVFRHQMEMAVSKLGKASADWWQIGPFVKHQDPR
jgi:hypothetical protein